MKTIDEYTYSIRGYYTAWLRKCYLRKWQEQNLWLNYYCILKMHFKTQKIIFYCGFMQSPLMHALHLNIHLNIHITCGEHDTRYWSIIYATCIQFQYSRSKRQCAYEIYQTLQPLQIAWGRSLLSADIQQLENLSKKSWHLSEHRSTPWSKRWSKVQNKSNAKQHEYIHFA